MEKDPLYPVSTQLFEKRHPHNTVTHLIKQPHKFQTSQFLFCKKNSHNFIFHNFFEIRRFSHPNLLFIMGNKRNRRFRRAESPDVEENLSETSIFQGNATLTNVSENADNVFESNLGSELTEPSQVSNETEVIPQTLTEQHSTKRSQIEEHSNCKIEEFLKEIRANRNCDRRKDDENCDPGPSSSGNKHLKKKHASNIKNNKNRNQDNHFPPSDMDELRQSTTPLGVVNENLDETIVMNENRQEDDYDNIKV